MSGYVDALRGILNSELIVSGGGGLTLAEAHAQGGPPVTLTSAGRAVCIALDRLGNQERIPWLDASVPGLSQICDYAVVVESAVELEVRTSVLLVDLKSRNTSGAHGQIANGFLLMDWLLALARRHRGASGLLNFRGIVFATGLHGRTDPKGLRRVFGQPADIQEKRPIFRLPRADRYDLAALVQ